MAGDRLSRRDVLGGLMSAAAVGAAMRGTALASPAADEIRRSGGMLRLGSNENATGLGPAARAAFLAAMDEANRYPGGVWSSLVEALTSRHQIDRSWIHVTPGSGALLSAATLAFTGASRSLVTAAPTFEAPMRTAGRTGATVHAVPVTADGRLDLDAMLAKAAGAGLIYVCNPNNPTGGGVPGAALTAFVEKLKTVAPDARVLVDEAYFEYADEPGYATAVPLAVADRRVLVTRTFSKVFGMAGLRVGYAIAHPDTLAALEEHGPDGTLSNASLAAATAAFTDSAHIAAECARNRAVRQFTRERFDAAGYRVLPSAANFVMVDIKRDAGSFGWECRRQRIAVARPFPPLTTCMRLTIGTQAEMDEAVPAILALLQSAPPASARARHAPFDWIAGAGC
jgi:histidinol-phosphate aminotransferase